METYEFVWYIDGTISVKVRDNDPKKAEERALEIAHERVRNLEKKSSSIGITISEDTPFIYPKNYEDG